MRVEWTLFAMNDREAIFDYLEADSPRAAILIDDRIETQVELLTDMPEIGRPGRIDGTRELVTRGRLISRPTGLKVRPSRSCESCMGLKSGRKRWSPSRAGAVNPKTGISGDGIPMAARVNEHTHRAPDRTAEFIQDLEKATQRQLALQKRGPREKIVTDQRQLTFDP